MDTKYGPPARQKNTTGLPTPVHRWILITLQVIMALEFLLVLYEKQWFNAFLIMTIMVITLLPAVLGHRFRVYIPPEFHVLAVIFIFAALFLGEIHSYYARFWWWDIALHTSSGLLIGVLGFLLVYVLNESIHSSNSGYKNLSNAIRDYSGREVEGAVEMNNFDRYISSSSYCCLLLIQINIECAP